MKLTEKQYSELETIAKKKLRISTLKTRMSDRLDFHEVSVWGVEEALTEAYTLGMNEALVATGSLKEK